MQSKSDAELLREFALNGNELAFAELVTRYTNLVYSAASRQTDSPQMAEEASQLAFIALARGAQSLSGRMTENGNLAGWLCRSARNASLNLRRNEIRQYNRERKTMEHLAPDSETARDWDLLRPVLDAAMSELGENDFDLLAMRYFDNKDLRSVGVAFGVTDDTAQKRVSRALNKLRDLLSRKGISSSCAALALVLSSHAVKAAPVGLGASICSASVSSALLNSTSIGFTKTVLMTTLQKAIVLTAFATVLGTGLYEAKRAAVFQSQALVLKEQRDSLADENQKLRLTNELAVGKLAAAQQVNRMPSESMKELLRLRSEVGRSHENSRELAQLKAAISNDSGMNATLKSWSARAAQLKLRLEQMPDKKTPELGLLTDKEWFDAVKSGKPLETDADFRKALKELRNIAKVDFAELTRSALKKFAGANNGMLPADLSLLQSYFDMPVDSTVLQRYSIIQSGNLKDVVRGEPIFAERAAPADMEYDSSYEFSMNGTTSWDVNDPKDIVSRGLTEFAKAHQGILPKEASELAPYLTRQVDEVTANKVLAMIPAGVVTLNQLKALDR